MVIYIPLLNIITLNHYQKKKKKKKNYNTKPKKKQINKKGHYCTHKVHMMSLVF